MGEVFKVASECDVSKPMNTASVHVNVDCAEIDVAIEKANRLVGLLREASTLIDSLAGSPKAISAEITQNLQESLCQALREDSLQ